ncbi:AIR synthase family protein [Lachnoclostridium sp. An138]|uniref:AIR synthase family protein n=1 Tax=Lachnoclostridium sp. An138 TaxID=1965560 RepID=UPI000B37CA22|nr:AIR synthase family protein [Lachnoclostridium sp. An138]OUQ17968.1 hydrogenase maturation factor [Lachnoclostridium sp. An138]
MKIGKVSETVLKRSIFKQIHTKRDEVLLGAGVGEDCAAVKLSPGEIFVISTDPITGTVKDVGMLAIQITANDLASSGAEPVGVMLTVLLPEEIEEEDIREMMRQVEEACAHFHIQVMGGHTEVTRAVTQPVISVTGVGKVREDRLVSTAGAKPGQDILVTKWIGIEGTSIIAKEKEKELLERFSQAFVDTAKGFDQYLSVLPDSRIAVEHGVSAMHDVTEGGIYGALWEVAEASGIGLEIDLKAIPIRQETIEICEYFELNPYYLISSGCMLMAADQGHDLVRKLEAAGIPAAVIGKATDGKARRIWNGGEESYLERPKTDELYKIYHKN